MKRVEVLAEIADRYWELVDPNHRNGERGSGDREVKMPASYTNSVKEFERLLNVMRNQGRQKAFKGEPLCVLRWQVLAWHVNARKIIRHEPVLVFARGRWQQVRDPETGELVTRPTVNFSRDRQAREEKARLGLEWMAENWGLLSEPMLPKGFSPYEKQAKQPVAA